MEHLGRGEEILVLDRLAHAAERERCLIGDAMERCVGRGAPTQDGLDALLAVADDPELVGIAFAVASYGEGRAVRALAAALNHIGRAAQREGGGYTVHLEGGTAFVGRLLWGLTAQGIAVGNPTVLGVSRTAALPVSRGEREVVPMGADRRLRYAIACGSDAALTFRHYLDWLQGLEFVRSSSPYLVLDLEMHLLEADFLFALMAADRGWGTTYAHGAHEGGVLARFAAHVGAWPTELALLLGVSEDALVAEVLRRAENVRGPDRFFGDRSPLRALLGSADS
ncbi:MAG: hypothetical protein K2Q09_11590 [Phycisphaerales bacterium]|nr:hypothetical protein [Phycisphaerales bacterium]